MNALQDLYSLTDESQDDAKTWAFAVCTVLTYNDELVPEAALGAPTVKRSNPTHGVA